MDYFNKEERKAQEKFRDFRDKFFKKLTRFLTKNNIKANHISYLGILFALVAIVFDSENWLWFFIFISLYLLMDGIDGSVARLSGQTHNGGSLVDIFADQIGIVLIPAAAIYHLQVDGVISLLFATGYLVLIAFVTYENELNNYKQRKFIRIKYPVYLIYGLSLIISSDKYLYYTFLIGSAYYWIECFIRLNSIHSYFDKKDR